MGGVCILRRVGPPPRSENGCFAAWAPRARRFHSLAVAVVCFVCAVLCVVRCHCIARAPCGSLTPTGFSPPTHSLTALFDRQRCTQCG